jgi:16S rRNA (guanine527-N7)-methyltransferase
LTEATKYWNIKPRLHASLTGQGWIVELDQIERQAPSARAAHGDVK